MLPAVDEGYFYSALEGAKARCDGALIVLVPLILICFGRAVL
jgi:hypothetical protein